MYWAILIGMHSKCLVMVVGQYDTITLILSVLEINMWFFLCVHACAQRGREREVGKVLLRISEGTGTAWKN